MKNKKTKRIGKQKKSTIKHNHQKQDEQLLQSKNVYNELKEAIQLSGDKQQLPILSLSNNVSLVILKFNMFYKLHFNDPSKHTIHFINGYIQSNGEKHIDFLTDEQTQHLIFQCKNQKLSTNFKDKNIVKVQINKIIPSCINEDNQQFANWIQLFDLSMHMILMIPSNSWIQQSSSSWQNLPNLQKQSAIMMIGIKNSGKSKLTEYIYNNNCQSTCILDVDPGKNRFMPGCVSLNDNKQIYKIWVGQLTPIHNIYGYLNSIQCLYNLYRQRLFTKTLIINTMGYLSGFGQILLYQTYNIVKPSKVIILKKNEKSQILYNIKKQLQLGSYAHRLYFSKQNHKISTSLIEYQNIHCGIKNSLPRFQHLLANTPIKSIQDILILIHQHKLAKIHQNLIFLEQYKNGLRKIIDNSKINMRMMILGNIQKDCLFVQGLGYGWQGVVYYDQSLIKNRISYAIVTQGIDFQKRFYHLNESKLINLQLIIGKRIPYIQQVVSCLGSKGTRNLPSRKTLINQ